MEAGLGERLLKILIADDDRDDRYFAALAFKEAGLNHAVHFVQHGEELMEHLRKMHTAEGAAGLPDLILLDLNMPKKDGRVALKEMKSDKRFEKLNVVIFSTFISGEDKIYTTELGAVQHITKPFDFYELVGMIKLVCNSFGMKKPHS